MYLTTSPLAAGISLLVSALAVALPPSFHTSSVTGKINMQWLFPIGIMPLSGALDWTLLILLVLIALVSIRILITQRKFKEELNQLSDIEKDS